MSSSESRALGNNRDMVRFFFAVAVGAGQKRRRRCIQNSQSTGCQFEGRKQVEISGDYRLGRRSAQLPIAMWRYCCDFNYGYDRRQSQEKESFQQL